MKKLKSAITLLLMLSFAVSMFAVLPNTADAVIAVPNRDTGSFISVNPKVVGASQPLTVNIWIYPSPNGPNFEIGLSLKGIAGFSGMHFSNLSITFTRPDGSKDTFLPEMGTTGLGLKPGQTDEVGGIWFLYTPTQIGTWSASFSYPGETFTIGNYSVYYKPSTSQTITFEVQQDPVQIGLPPAELPTGYWERPVNAQFREWGAITGDWLGSSPYGGSPSTIPGNIYSGFQPYSTAPNSAHIVWKSITALEGITGGDWGGLSYTYGLAFTGLANAPIIWNGRVFITNAGMNGPKVDCMDLRTGELIWSFTGSFSNAQLASGIGGTSSNYLGVVDAGTTFAGSATPYLWYYSATDGWKTYNAFTGQLTRTIATNIPNLGTPTWASETIAYCLRQGTWSMSTLHRPFNELIKWNMSKVVNNDWKTGIVWNITLKQPDGTGPGEGSRGSAIKLLPDQGLVLVTTIGETKYYGYDLETGALLWVHEIGFTQMSSIWTPEGNLMAYDSSAAMTMHCWSISRAGVFTELWAVPLGEYPWDSNLSNPRNTMAYGNFYGGSYSGTVFCVDMATGEQKWSYSVGNTTETPFGSWAIYKSCASADGKIYFGNSEHSPTQPRTRGNKLTCIDAYTGEEVWHITGAMGADAIADGYLLSNSEYDGYLYCFGKGKTETTITAPSTAITQGQSIELRGTVMDMSPASAGTAAISDEAMSAWMEYLHQMDETYINNPPMNAKGVEVSLDTVDPNGNFVHIGTVTSDSSGLFKKLWTPEVPGEYTVIATFHGSESYWASYAETAVGVVEASAVTPPAETILPDNTPIYTAIIGAAIAIIIAVAIAVVLILRKKP